jgi:hypothetical protein
MQRAGLIVDTPESLPPFALGHFVEPIEEKRRKSPRSSAAAAPGP